uniref:Tail protein n=1 Tax=viral metagenome TaxID=1070528 RepID=A0A6M3IHJ6_9ZZZZ
MVSIGEGPAELVKRYLVTYLTTTYGSGTIHEDSAEHVGTFAAPQFTVQAEGEDYNAIGWATCHVRVFSVIQNLDSEDQHEDTNDLVSHLVDTVRTAVRTGTPSISTVGPPYYDVEVKSTKTLSRPENLRVDVVFDFKTGVAPGGV